MRSIRFLLRVYSYFVLGLIIIASLAMSGMILASPHHTVRVGWLPWTGEALGAWLAGLGIFGIAAFSLALSGRTRWFMVLFSLVVAWLVIRGLFFSAWQFAGATDFWLALWVALGLIFALLGALTKSE